MHTSVSAAQYLANANAFFSISQMGRFGYDSAGNVWGQAIDVVDPSKAINKPFVITADMANRPGRRQVLRPDMATEIGAIDLGHPSFAADPQPPHASCHSLAQLMRQHEPGLVMNVQITGERQHALALHFNAEHRDGEQVTPQPQLVPGEQRSGRERKVVAARFAAPARLTPRSTTGVTGRAATVRTDRLAVGLRLTQPKEDVLHPEVRHPHHLGEAERTCGGG